MAVYWTERVWSCAGLTATEKLVALRIADRANEKTGEAFPGVRSLAADCSLTPAGTLKVINRLLATGVLDIAAEATGKRSRCYRLDADKLVAVNTIDRKKERRSPPCVQHHRTQQASAETPSGQCHRTRKAAPEAPSVRCHRTQAQPLAVDTVSVAVDTVSSSVQCHRTKPLEPSGTKIIKPAAPGCDDEHDERKEPEPDGTPFRVYAAIATKAIERSLRDDRTDDLANVIEHFKRLCAQHTPAPMPYDGDLSRKACEAALHSRAKKRDALFQNMRRAGMAVANG